MQMTDGRYYSRQGDDHMEGHDLIASILQLAQFAPSADAAAYNSIVKSWVLADTYRNFVVNHDPPFNVQASSLLADPSVIPAPELLRHYQFPHMDEAVHLRPGWGFALSMSSSRGGNYESIQRENLHGWYTGDGMTYLYNTDLGQFAELFGASPEAFEGKTFSVDLPDGFKQDGATFDHFGLMNMMKPGGRLKIYFDDLRYLDRADDFSTDRHDWSRSVCDNRATNILIDRSVSVTLNPLLSQSSNPLTFPAL